MHSGDALVPSGTSVGQLPLASHFDVHMTPSWPWISKATSSAWVHGGFSKCELPAGVGAGGGDGPGAGPGEPETVG